MNDTCLYPYVDLHSHLQFDDFNHDREEIIQEMGEKNVITINIGTTPETSLLGIELAKKYPDTCYATIGLHPVYAAEGDTEHLEKFAEMLESCRENIIGIGECGMDFFRENIQDKKEKDNKKTLSQDPSYHEIQEKVFINQIELSKRYRLPLMLHVRESYQKTLSILSKNFNFNQLEYRGNAHFFIGSIEEAQAFLNLGFSISFTGVITFVKAYEELVRFVPLERMFAETDSPYVSPIPHRGKKNTPIHVIDIYKKIAEIKNIPLSVVRETLYKNACRYWFKDRLSTNL